VNDATGGSSGSSGSVNETCGMIIGLAAAKLTLGVSSSTVILGRTLGLRTDTVADAVGAGASGKNAVSSNVLGGPLQILVMKAVPFYPRKIIIHYCTPF